MRNRLVNGVNVNNTRNVNNTYRQSTLPKFEMKKRYTGTVRSFRKISEKNGGELREILVKKGCKEGGLSL